MSFCFVFSGTSEGRELCEALAEKGVKCFCFVATEYGSSVMKEHENILVKVGRLERDDIEKLISDKNPDYIIDATHPYAEIVTENIKAACRNAGYEKKYLRVSRDIDSCDDLSDTVVKVKSCEEAVEITKENYSGKIMLTTGVKELENFCVPELKDRLVVRILPGKESIEETTRLGISSKSVIAMEGPFSEEMNEALIKQYGVSVLVTKNSGSRGGYKEKIKACQALGIKAIVIEKDIALTDSVTTEEAIRLITGSFEKKKKVFLVGTGVCNEETLTVEALNIIKNSELLIGAKRMVEFASTINGTAQIISEYIPDKVFNIVKSSELKTITVLFSGDTGLSSGAKGVYNILNNSGICEVTIIPGISSVSYLSAKLGIQYSDYPFISIHGKSEDYMSVLEKAGGFIAICSGREDVKKVYKDIISSDYTLNRTLSLKAGYNLGSDSERIIDIKEEIINSLEEGLYVFAVVPSEESEE